jgi:signal transduction histidine kinase
VTVPSADPVNILLVDDQPAKLLSYEVVLAELGEVLITATSAREALAKLLKHDIAVVLIDVQMPDLDGFELAAMIREHPRFQQTALIFVSAHYLSDLDRLRGYEVGAVDYVPVPVVPAVLRAKVRVFAELHRKTRQLERLNAELEKRVAERTAALEDSSAALHRLNEDLEVRITERTREREQALAQLFEAQKIDTIGQLTGGVAHDFNNLLMAMMGSLELLQKRFGGEAIAQRLIDNALQAAERGAALTQRLLAFARRQELKPEAVDVGRLIVGMRDLLGRALGPSVEITQDIPARLPPAQVDSNQLELALLNLAVNSRDAMPSGGKLNISAQRELIAVPEPGVLLQPGEYIRLTVTDTGEGMDEETCARASEPFFTTKGIGKGTGLGLSMVHGLAAQSGGALKISSQPGRGARIDLWLPRAEERPVRRKAPASATAPPQSARPATILLVDDDLLVSTGTAAMLEDLGHFVLIANSGAEALGVLSSTNDVELILTDQAMPGMTGLELARRVRQSQPEMGIILATGYADNLVSECDDLGLPRLSKPFSQQNLAALISQHIKPLARDQILSPAVVSQP